jgi:hypothetical protein
MQSNVNGHDKLKLSAPAPAHVLPEVRAPHPYQQPRRRRLGSSSAPVPADLADRGGWPSTAPAKPANYWRAIATCVLGSAPTAQHDNDADIKPAPEAPPTLDSRLPAIKSRPSSRARCASLTQLLPLLCPTSVAKLCRVMRSPLHAAAAAAADRPCLTAATTGPLTRQMRGAAVRSPAFTHMPYTVSPSRLTDTSSGPGPTTGAGVELAAAVVTVTVVAAELEPAPPPARRASMTTVGCGAGGSTPKLTAVDGSELAGLWRLVSRGAGQGASTARGRLSGRHPRSRDQAARALST